MGILLKFLLILGLSVYLINKFSSFLFRRVLKTMGFTPPEREKRRKRRTKRKGLHIDHMPEEEQKDRRRSQNYKGGEYVDFEEV
ncbi:MAG TPA: hypothetical protein DCS93_14980 [Microscillaceae bacterium]|nr:hypothetical protein [Microscillaceae bacterium]